MKNRFYLFIVFLLVILLNTNVYATGEATLKKIKVNSNACTCSKTECSISLVAENATITYELTDSNAKVDRYSGFNVDLLSEITSVKITVTNTVDGEQVENVYTINITKLEKQNNFALKSLKVNGSAMKVGEDIISYNYECEYDTKKIVLDIVPVESKFKVIQEKEYIFEENAKTLSANFYIEADNGERLEYAVIATRREKPDTTLKSLKLDYGTLEFDEKTTEYEITVPYNINELNIEAEANNKDAKVDIQNDDLVVGENDITITVTSNRSKTVYKIHVIREENIDKSIANLSSITIDEYKKLNFSENVLEYDLNFYEIPNKLNIHAISKNEDSEISVLQNDNLKDGSKIIVKNQLNENKVTREYVLNIHLVTGSVSNKKTILVCIIILVITMAILLFLDIHSRKNEKKRYLKKVFDLRKKVEKLKNEGKLIPRIKKKNKKQEGKEEELEII